MDLYLTLAGLLPALVLCVYIYIKDRTEKEPILLLIQLLAAGVAIIWPISIVEGALLDLFEGNAVLENFLGIALVEEGFKLIAVLVLTKKSEEFNSIFDGIVYATFVSLGFAAVENVLYVTHYGWINAAMRAVMSVPAHTFFGIMMGYYYSFWAILDRVAAKERILKEKGLVKKSVPEYSSVRFVVASVLVPVFLHGLYDYCCTSSSMVALVVFVVLLIVMYIYCFGKVRKMSKIDAPVNNYVFALLAKKYPELKAYIYNNL